MCYLFLFMRYVFAHLFLQSLAVILSEIRYYRNTQNSIMFIYEDNRKVRQIRNDSGPTQKSSWQRKGQLLWHIKNEGPEKQQGSLCKGTQKMHQYSLVDIAECVNKWIPKRLLLVFQAVFITIVINMYEKKVNVNFNDNMYYLNILMFYPVLLFFYLSCLESALGKMGYI